MNNTPQNFNAALAALNGRDMARAETLLRQVIEADSSHVAALNLLVIVLMSMERFAEAEPFIKRATALSQSSDVSFYNFGLVSKRLNKPQQALENFDKALDLNPNVAETWNNRGTIFNDLQRYESAVADFDKAISLNALYVDAYANKGKSLTLLKRSDEALAAYDKALSIKPDLENAWLGRGDILSDLKRYDEALAAYHRALAIRPELEGAWLGLGNIFADFRRYDDAVAAYDKALSIRPDLASAWLGCGNVFTDLSRYDEAFAQYDKALSIKPDLENAWVGRGNLCGKLKRYDEALAAYDKALSINPDSKGAWLGRATVFSAQNHDTEALKCLNTAIELDPLYAQAHCTRSVVLLRLGEYADGWEEYEWRKKLPLPVGNRPFAKPCLLNRDEVKGATVFIYGEQGLGDHIHFCRYAKLVADRGAKVILEAPKSLFQLFKSLDGVSQLIEEDQSIPPFDYHCSLMSLPRFFRTTLENVPNKVPYLLADPAKVKAWAGKLGAKSKLRIGLVWSGGFRPNQPELWATNEKRNMPLTKLAPLGTLDAAFYSLQKGDRAVAELKELLTSGWRGPSIIDWTDELTDFSDTAALVENLDLVVSVDTSTAHLAGAMGKPVCLLNRFDTEWRWLPNSPWYPTVKSYRQIEAGNWEQVIENLKADLIGMLSSKSGSHLLLQE